HTRSYGDWSSDVCSSDLDKTLIPVQETAGLIPNINYRGANWTGHTGYTNILQGAASYITGAHSTKFDFRWHNNDSTFPKNYYNRSEERRVGKKCRTWEAS